jgi:hypothetical protein
MGQRFSEHREQLQRQMKNGEQEQIINQILNLEYSSSSSCIALYVRELLLY